MGIWYDSAKNERNIRERGLSFERAADYHPSDEDLSLGTPASISRQRGSRTTSGTVNCGASQLDIWTSGCTFSATFPKQMESA